MRVLTVSDHALTFAAVEKEILTELEACAWLTIDIDFPDDPEKQIEALNRLVDEKKTLNPCMFRRERRYRLTELRRFAESQQKVRD